MTEARATETRSILPAIAGFGLAPGRSEALSIPEDGWRSALGGIIAQRLTGLAVAAMDAGHLLLSEEQAEQLMAAHGDAMVWALTVERKLLALAGAFDDAGVPFVVLKGPAVGHRFYPDPSRRAFGDLDLLVRTRDWRRACDVLVATGHGRRLPEPRPGFDERFGKAAVHAASDGVEVDLHRTLVVGPFGLLTDPEELFGRAVEFSLGGRRLPALDDTAALLHACIHASLGWRPPLLLPLRDVLQVAGAGDVNWELLADWARRWRLTAVIRHAFETATSTLGAPLPAGAEGIVAARTVHRDARLLEAYTTDRRGRGGTELAMLRAIPGLRAKAAYVRDLVFPTPEFLASRSGNGARASYVRRWAVAAGWFFRRHGEA